MSQSSYSLLSQVNEYTAVASSGVFAKNFLCYTVAIRQVSYIDDVLLYYFFPLVLHPAQTTWLVSQDDEVVKVNRRFSEFETVYKSLKRRYGTYGMCVSNLV